MVENTERTLLRDCAAIRIPSGEKFVMPRGTRVFITQALGGSFTVAGETGLARIADADADALGMEPTEARKVSPVSSEGGEVDEQAVWDQLRSCYDPEIPVNIVDLGLVYDCVVKPLKEGGARVEVKMTLTAPGCGMGPTIAAEARQKLLGVPGVSEAEVDLVWDPPWNQAMISEAGMMKLGLM